MTPRIIVIGGVIGGLAFMILISAQPSAIGNNEDGTYLQKARIMVGPNVLVSRKRDGNLAETLVAADPTNAKNLLGTGIVVRTNHALGGQETRGFYSRDGGYSWTDIVFPETAEFGGGDPLVAYGRTGTGYFVTLWDGSGIKQREILIYRSEDGGLTWATPAHLVGPYDHPVIVVDHTFGIFAGNVYISTMYERGHEYADAHVGVFRSTDDGRSWIGPVEVANNHNIPGRRVQVGDPALFTDGELFVPFVDFPYDPTSGATLESRERVKYNYWFVTSKDGGATFTSPQRFALEGGGEIQGPLSTSAFFAIDNSDGPFRNRVYIVWPNRWFAPGLPSTKARFLISHSSDRGKTWSKPKVVSAGLSGVGDQFIQSIAVNNEGTVAVSWYDTCDTPVGKDDVLINRYFTASIDGGETFIPAVRVSSAPTDRATVRRNLVGAKASGTVISFLNGGWWLGEYLGLTSDKEGTFHSFWIDGRTGSYQIWAARIRVERAELLQAQTATVLDLVEADVSDRVEAFLEPIRESLLAGTVELPIRLKNKSDRPIYGPIKVEVVSLLRADGSINILNASNAKSGLGALFDYSRALGDFDSLPSGAISEGVVWRFRVPTNDKEFPRFKFKVTARIEKPKEATPRKP